MAGRTTCDFVDPRAAQGANWWANENVDGGAVAAGEAPLTAPFYVVKRNGYEERHWIARDTGYDTNLRARRVIGMNARPMDGEPGSGLEWFASSDLCDEDRPEVACPKPAPPPPAPEVPAEPAPAAEAETPTDVEAAWLWAALAQLAEAAGQASEAAPEAAAAAAEAPADAAAKTPAKAREGDGDPRDLAVPLPAGPRHRSSGASVGRAAGGRPARPPPVPSAAVRRARHGTTGPRPVSRVTPRQARTRTRDHLASTATLDPGVACVDRRTRFLIWRAAGAAVTASALRPPDRFGRLAPLEFVTGVPTSEMPFHVGALQGGLALLGARRGGARGWRGAAGLGLAAASAAGLWRLHRDAEASEQVLEDALVAGLGPAYHGEITEPFTPAPAAAMTRRSLLLPSFARRSRYTAPDGRNVVYGDAGPRNRLDIWKRADLPDDAGAPVLLQVHGGAWVIGQKEGQAHPLMGHLADRGWVCVTINYRLSPRATWPEHIVDVKRAIAWTRAHIADNGGDPEFLAISGGSAGDISPRSPR